MHPSHGLSMSWHYLDVDVISSSLDLSLLHPALSHGFWNSRKETCCSEVFELDSVIDLQYPMEFCDIILVKS